ncbi:hypothetical protein KIH74_20605 [Kineosporia sp. J2-2]|uniref:Uncharacterized protein n=1 Tax=Kineosporia corallincola TaxID=2835133 RepID=A0ABS5TJV1_9ACTN|nr:DUF6284 family protein [Kineosporia corallincola]MBT0771351.1 hypothetical protein [Kineosporia corallincola]
MQFREGDNWPPGPTRRELRAIEAEWPLIERELAVTDAESVIAANGREVSELDWARLRRAEAELNRISRDLFNLAGPLGGAA